MLNHNSLWLLLVPAVPLAPAVLVPELVLWQQLGPGTEAGGKLPAAGSTPDNTIAVLHNPHFLLGDREAPGHAVAASCLVLSPVSPGKAAFWAVHGGWEGAEAPAPPLGFGHLVGRAGGTIRKLLDPSCINPEYKEPARTSILAWQEERVCNLACCSVFSVALVLLSLCE